MSTPEDREAMIEAGYIDRETNSFTEKGILQGLWGLTPGTPHYEAEAAMMRRAETEPSDDLRVLLRAHGWEEQGTDGHWCHPEKTPGEKLTIDEVIDFERFRSVKMYQLLAPYIRAHR